MVLLLYITTVYHTEWLWNYIDAILDIAVSKNKLVEVLIQVSIYLHGVLTLSLTCVRLRSHFSLGLEGEKEVESELSAS